MDLHVMFRKMRGLLAMTAAAGILVTNGCSPGAGDILVAKVGTTPITLADYEALYIKSNGSREQAAASTMDEREKFLDLMTKFRLKLADAYSMGLERSPEIQAEINQYRGSLAASFLTDREVTTPGIRALYNRRSEEIRASHILITLPPDAAAEDSIEAYNKITDLLQQLKAGADFESLAVAHSQDPSVKQNGGDLYYFTGGQMVSAFEDAAYAMKVGEISSSPVRTPYGLHLLKIVDRKSAPGEVRCSHIMIRFERQDPSPEDTLAALAKINAIRDSLVAGGDFAALAIRNSGDPGSASKGGDLEWFTRRRWIQSFDEVALSMKPGQISGVVRTIYGYHLIKCTDARPPKDFQESLKELQQQYQQVKFQEDYRRYLARLRKETGYMLEQGTLERFIAACDTNTSTRDSGWASGFDDGLRQEPLFRFGTRTVSVDSVIAIIKKRPDMANTPLRSASIRSSMDKIGEQLIYEVKAETIERDYPEFASIMREYTDGILLYQIEQDKVWSRIAVTDSALKWYHENHRDQFKFPDRVDYSVIRVIDDSLAAFLHQQILAGKTFEAIQREDSIRMSLPSNFQVLFTGNSLEATRQSQAVLDRVARDLQGETTLRLHLTAYHDTLGPKGRREQLAMKRLDAVKKHCVRKLGIAESRISTFSRTPPRGSDEEVMEKMFARMDVDLVGRRPSLNGGIEHQVVPADNDERAEQAAALKPGEYSEVFKFQNVNHIVRLNGLEPARLKSFEEAGTEVSSAFQEYESKRLEQEWLDGLRARYTVVEHKEALKNAFAPSR